MLSVFSTYKTSLRQTAKLASPIIAGQLGHILMGFFDTVQVGGLGPEYIAATGIANTVYWLVTLLGLGILFAISPLVSEAFGEQKGEKAIGIFRSSIVVAIIISIIFTILMVVAIDNFEVFRQPKEISTLAKRYLVFLNFSTPALMLFTAGKQLIDGMGRTLPGMIINIAALLLNVLFNWLLIYGKWGFPELGIEGAAIASAIARVAMAIAIFVFIWQDKNIQRLMKSYNQSVYKSISFVKPILLIGVPASLQVFSEAAAFCSAHIMCGWIGELELASHQIAINLVSITFMTITGISAAGTIMTGYAFGAKDILGIRVNGNAAIILTLMFEVVFVIFFFATYNVLPLLYTNNIEVVTMASSLILLAVFFQLSDGLQNVAVGILRGIQDVRIPATIAFVSYWLIMIPTCYLLAFNFGLGVKGIWFGFIIGLSISAILLTLRFRYKTAALE